MKKSFLSVMLAVGVFSVGGAEAQITLLHTFEGVVSPGGVLVDSGGNYYGAVTVGSVTSTDFNGYYNITRYDTYPYTSQLRFYNEDFSIRALVNINGYVSSVSCISEKIFNTDGKLEFIVTSRGSEGYGDFVRLYDENGNVLQNFATVGTALGAGLHLTSGGNYRLHVIRQNDDYKSYTDIYSLPGKKEVSVLPQPKRETRALAYKLKEGETATMKIYNIKGQVVDTKLIDHTFNKILLNTARYPRGTYIYKINDKNAKKFTLK